MDGGDGCIVDNLLDEELEWNLGEEEKIPEEWVPVTLSASCHFTQDVTATNKLIDCNAPQSTTDRFLATSSSNFTKDPPKISNEL